MDYKIGLTTMNELKKLLLNFYLNIIVKFCKTVLRSRFFWFLLSILSASVICFLLIGKVGLSQEDANSNNATSEIGGAVALSTLANQAVEFGKNKFSNLKKNTESNFSEDNNPLILGRKLLDIDKRVINCQRKIKGIEVFLTRTTEDFNPKDTDYD